MSRFAGVMTEARPELWRFKQYDLSQHTKTERLVYLDQDPNDPDKTFESSKEYSLCSIDIPGKALFLEFVDSWHGAVVMNVLEDENSPMKPNKLLIAEFGEKLPKGQFAYVGSVKGGDKQRYVFAVSNINPYVEKEKR